MKQLFFAASAAALLAASPAWAQATPQPAAPGAGPQHRGAPITLNEQDRTFIDKAGPGGIVEVEFGKLAEQKAENPAVQEFGRWMVADHSALNRRLAYIAQRAGVIAPKDMDAAQRQEYERLMNVPRAQFDRDYMQGQLNAHEETVALFKKEESGGEDRMLKGFARAALPLLEAHLEEAQSLTKAPGVAGSPPPASGTTAPGH